MTHAAFRRISTFNPSKNQKAERTQHFLGQALHLTSRVRDHVERLDNGVVYAVDDLAVALRAMLSTGKGNDVLGRLHRLVDYDIELQVSAPPRQAGTLFSVGSLPVCGQGAIDDGAQWVPLNRWAHTPLLRIALDSEKKTYTWGTFLDAYANKWGGAHLDKELPAHLPMIDVYEAGGHLLSAYLLRCAAVQAWLIAQQLIQDALKFYIPSRATETGTVWIGSEGAITRPPADRRTYGELQYLDYDGDEVNIIHYHDDARTSSLRISAGGTFAYDLAVKKGELVDLPALDTQRVRKFEEPEALDFSQGKLMNVNGKFRTYTETDADCAGVEY